MKIINVGIYPPPFGGVSNHLKRLLEYLLKSNKNTLLIDTSKIKKQQEKVININRKLVLFYLFKEPRSIVHFHGFDLKTLVLVYLTSFRHITMISLHNEWFLDQMKAKGDFIYTVSSFLFRRIKIILVPNIKCWDMARTFIDEEGRLAIIPAFIPPVEIPPLEVEQIIDLRKKHKFIISTNAFQIDFYKGVEVYGIDIIIEMMNIMIHTLRLDVAMAFLLPNIGNESYFSEMKERIKKYNLEERFIFITKPVKESSSLWAISDIILRATNTDGNSLTVLEGLSMRIPVIASDCVERPEGTILFKSRDIKDLTNKVRETLENLNNYKEKLKYLKIDNNAEKIIKIYDALSKGEK